MRFSVGGWKVLQLWPSKNLKILSHEYEAPVSSKQKVVSFESLGTFGEGELQTKVRPWPKEEITEGWFTFDDLGEVAFFVGKKTLWFSQLGRRYKNIILLKALMISSLVFPPNTHTHRTHLLGSISIESINTFTGSTPQGVKTSWITSFLKANKIHSRILIELAVLFFLLCYQRFLRNYGLGVSPDASQDVSPCFGKDETFHWSVEANDVWGAGFFT